MLARAVACAVVGLEGHIVQVEVDISPGLPRFSIVGLPDRAVQEAGERVRAAIRNSGCEFPMRRITVNMTPADLPKAGSAYDLPIAVALLIASGHLPKMPDDVVFLGELSLDGTLRHTNGVLPMAAVARDEGVKRVFAPAVNAGEAALVRDVEVLPVQALGQLVLHLQGKKPIPPLSHDAAALNGASAAATQAGRHTDLADVRGQEHAKRALEVAAAGGHNMLMTGPPGSGKTLLARALPSILPPMTYDEAMDVTKIYSVSGLLPTSEPFITERPFRAPHYTISNAGLVGGGSVPRPGEITLSHRGVLFLDELPEFGRNVLEVLRQPIEDSVISISRAQGTITYPANFMLVAARNPCPCGYYGSYNDASKQCVCSPHDIARYARRISGPLLDRIDIFVDVPRVEYEKLTSANAGESSAQARHRVEQAALTQRNRLAHAGMLHNADMGPNEVLEFCEMNHDANEIMRMAMSRMGLSARGFHRILKVARTIADLSGSDAVERTHLTEALQYRQAGEL